MTVSFWVCACATMYYGGGRPQLFVEVRAIVHTAVAMFFMNQ